MGVFDVEVVDEVKVVMVVLVVGRVVVDVTRIVVVVV